MRKIAVVTGTRAEYGILHPVLKVIEARSELELSLVVTGMHLSHEFGYTAREIEADGFRIVSKVDMLLSSDSPESMAKTVGLGIFSMAQTWGQLRPDIIVVFGDRVEALAAAIAGAYMNIPLAHIHGGDAAAGSNIDDSNRYAITKFAHIHFPATRGHAERIIRLGENPWRVHITGSPALDVILNEPLLSGRELARKFALDLSKPLILLIQHSVTTQVDEAPEQMRETLAAILETGYPTVLTYPNSDAGGRKMIEVIREYEQYPLIKAFKSLPRRDYLSLMRVARVIVGNSSSGIIEAPSFGIPVVNIGIRQMGRERGRNVIDVGHDKKEIIEAMEKATDDKVFLNEARECENPYGDGKAGERIGDILSKIELTPSLIQKKITY